MASEDEWYKAAYDDGKKDIYDEWPTGTDEPMRCAGPTDEPNTANCGLVTGAEHPDDPNFWGRADVTDVAVYPNSLSPWGCTTWAATSSSGPTISYPVVDQYHSGGCTRPCRTRSTAVAPTTSGYKWDTYGIRLVRPAR